MPPQDDIHSLFDQLKAKPHKEQFEFIKRFEKETQTITDPEPISPYLNDRDAAVRGYACEALGNIGDERAIPYLEAMADDPDGLVRGRAKKALRQFQTPPADE
jgi:HEAT repeat protein